MWAEMPRLVGTARSYEVNGSREQVSDETADLATIRAVSTRIQRPKAPVIDRMEVNMRNGVIDRNDKQLKKLAAVKAQARVLAADIATFLEAKPGLDNVQVDLHPPGEITVTAQPVIAGYTLPKVALIRMRGGSP